MNSRAPMMRIFAAMTMAFCVHLAAAAETPKPATFSFPNAAQEQDQPRTDTADQGEMLRKLVSAPCRQRLKNHRIVLLIAERTGEGWVTNQDRYGPLFHVLESRLQALGLKTYTQQQIKADIARAEVDAYFKNDPDDALAACKLLGADYILRG